jgi:hypothetical protein
MSNHQANPETLIKVEFLSINDKPFYGQVSDDELLYVWITVFGRKKEELFGLTSTKSLTRNVRATFKLKEPIRLSEITERPDFGYEKFLDDGKVEVITGKFIGFGPKPAEIGDFVKITARTGFNIEPAGILNWLKLYGQPSTKGDYLTNERTGLKTDVFECEIVLRRHIEEYLPIYGQKVQINYQGIPKQCNRCYIVGHLRRDCCNLKRDWIAYVSDLIEDNGIKEEMVGSWRIALERWRSSGASNKETPKAK